MKRIFLMLCLLTAFSSSPVLAMMWGYGGDYNSRHRCVNCFDQFNPRNAVPLACNHYALCPACLQDRVTEVIQGGRLADLRCSQAGCGHRMTQAEVQNIIHDQATRDRFEELQREHIARLAEGLSPDKQEIIRRNRSIKPCPACNDLIQKNDGCNHMTCRTNYTGRDRLQRRGCGHEFCWIDMQPWSRAHEDHHFGEYPRLEVRFDEQINDELKPKSVLIGFLIAAAASYGAYRLYKYFFSPKPVSKKDLKAHLEDLHKQAIKARMNMLGASGYAVGFFKNYFVNQEAKNAYKDLSGMKLTALRRIVDDLEKGLVAGDCDKQYAVLVKFISRQESNHQENGPIKPIRVQRNNAQVV